MPPTGDNCEWDYYEITGELDSTGRIKAGTRTELMEKRVQFWPDLPDYMIGIEDSDRDE